MSHGGHFVGCHGNGGSERKTCLHVLLNITLFKVWVGKNALLMIT